MHPVDKDTFLTADNLRRMLDYDSATGDFVWKEARQGRWNKKAGSLDAAGYRVIIIDGCNFKAHRLAWLYMTGDWPVDQIDHIDKNKSNNVWSNLRAASTSQNVMRTEMLSSNTSGYKGVNWHKRAGKWVARITYNNVRLPLGYFSSKEEASKAYLQKAKELFGEFAPL